MYIIVDSGSTKAIWCLVERGRILRRIVTAGINPVFAADGQLKSIIETEVLPKIPYILLDRILFYGSGCVDEERNKAISDILLETMHVYSVYVASDMLGAARSLLADQRGIACILGTGANTCVYNGKDIENSVHSGGFILGDEGSGAAIGRMLVSDYIKKRMPENIFNAFTEEYGLSYSEIVRNVYCGDYPGRYLAGFAAFLDKFRSDEYVQSILFDNFSKLFEYNIMQYPEHKRMPVNFIGSIACNFLPELNKAAYSAGIAIGIVRKDPIDGLVEYHTLYESKL